MIVLIRGVQDLEKRDERVKRAYTEHLLFVILRDREQAQILAAAGCSTTFRHYNIKRIHRPYYTEHSKKTFGN